jgi:hypothetical protein
MRLSKQAKAAVWGFCVGLFCSAFWFVPLLSDSHPEPMLIPGESRSKVLVSELWTGVWIFLGTGVPVAGIVALRPSKRED